MRRALCAAALVGALGVLAAGAVAAPAEDLTVRAAQIEAMLGAGQAKDGEAAARAALKLAQEQLGEESAVTANLYRLLGDSLYNQERYAEAEQPFQNAFLLRLQVLGPNNLDTAQSATDYALTLKNLKKYDDAEFYYQTALDLRVNLLGPEHADVAKSWWRLGRMYDAKGDYKRAADALGQAIAIGDKAFGPADRTVILWRSERGGQLLDAGELGAAETVYRETIANAEKTFAPDDLDLAGFRQGLATTLRQTDRPREAEPLYRQALAVRESGLDAADWRIASSVEGLALTLMQLDQPKEAESLFRRLLDLRATPGQPENAGVASAVRWIARALDRQSRAAEAEIFLKRALSISERIYEPTNIVLGYDLLALGLMYSGQQRFKEGEPLLTRAVAIMETAKDGVGHAVAARSALAFLHYAQGKHAEAAALVERSLADTVAADGEDSRAAADLMYMLADMRMALGQTAEAEKLLQKAAAFYGNWDSESRTMLRILSLLGDIRLSQGRLEESATIHADVLATLEKLHGKDAPETQIALASVGRTALAAGDNAKAVEMLERSVALVDRVAAIDAQTAFSARTGAVEDEAIARAATYDYLVKAYDRLAGQRPAERGALADKAFRVAQRVIESQAAAALSQLALRQAAGSGELAALVRERQDLVDSWRAEDRRLTEMRAAQPADPARLDMAEAALRTADVRIRAIDARLAADFPAFADLQQQAAVDFATVQARLGENQVLLFYADTTGGTAAGFETYLWAVTRHGAPRWVRLERATGELSGAVRTLRELMGVGAQTRGAKSLTTGSDMDRTGRVLRASHELYKALLGPVADMIEGKELMVVPSKKLASLPFQLLVSEAPEANASDRYAQARWLVRDHAITVLPSVASLGALPTAAAHDGRAPYLGFANPLLTGRNGDDRRAFDRTGCAATPPVQAATAEVDFPTVDALFRGAAADVAAVRQLEPLPETVDEACAVAAALGADERSVRLGAAATEAGVKALSDEGALSKARILHFATHGLVSGELGGFAEPAIVLTPPDAASERDDGLLTASEVTTLKLDADWVILSACNTAAGDAGNGGKAAGGEALSGLARAFFYAGARSLMVSHWPVNSAAAVSLATGAINAIAADPGVSRAEALRRAMLAEIDRGGAHADPANWAPFVVVGAS